MIAPLVAAAGNRNESPLLRQALPQLTKIARALGLDLQGSIVSLDGVYDCPLNRKAIFNRGMVPNINPNPRGRKHPKRGRKPLFDADIFEERFRTIERLFAWESFQFRSEPGAARDRQCEASRSVVDRPSISGSLRGVDDEIH